jgi:hypothetical protein
MDSFFVGRLSGTKGAVWQLTAIEVHSSHAGAELCSCPRGNPTGEQTSKLARRVAADLQAAGWQLERVLTHNGGEYRCQAFREALAQLGARHSFIRAGRPQTNGAVESLHTTMLEERWRPPSPATRTSASPGSNTTTSSGFATTTSTGYTPAAPPVVGSPPKSSTVPAR